VRKFLVGFELLGMPQRDLTPEQAADRPAAIERDLLQADRLTHLRVLDFANAEHREDQGLVTLCTAPDLAAARLMQGLLQSAGIDCYIPDENLLSQASYLGGIAVACECRCGRPTASGRR